MNRHLLAAVDGEPAQQAPAKNGTGCFHGAAEMLDHTLIAVYVWCDPLIRQGGQQSRELDYARPAANQAK